MKNISIWLDTTKQNECSNLDHDLETDILIIGGGLTGLSTAYHLKNSNLKICLVEQNTIGSGVTSKTTGKLTFLQENLYSNIKKYVNEKAAKNYLTSQIEAINLVTNIIEKENIECDLEKNDSYLFTNKDLTKIKKEKDLLDKFGIKTFKCNKLPNNIKIKSGFYTKNTYVFHPLKYLYTLKKICLNNNIDIYENTKIIDIEKDEQTYICKTDRYKIKTKYIVLAVHYPYFLLPFCLPIKSYIEKSYIMAFQTKNNYLFNAISITKPTLSIRYHQNYEIKLTNSHNTALNNNDIKNFNDLLNENPLSTDYLWSNNDIITSDYLPFIGAIDESKTLLIGTGYNTWGMTNGSLAGKILSDIILNKKNKYIKLFDPRRSLNLGKVLNTPVNIGSSICSFVDSKVSKNRTWYSKNVKFEKRDGKNIAIYVDENKKEHIVYNICPHLKCSLIFNEVEKTWDCPCHGSRFDIDGNVIEGPSNYSIKYKE